MGLLGSHTHTNTHTVTLTLCRLITVIAHTVFPALCFRVFEFFQFFFSVFRFWNRARRRLQLRSRPGHGARARKKRIKKAQTDCRWSEESMGGVRRVGVIIKPARAAVAVAQVAWAYARARGRQVDWFVLERESCYGLVGNSRNENSARLIIFTYCKTPSRLYRIERALITFRLCF